MSREYDNYLQQHKDNVRRGYEWIKINIPEVLNGLDIRDMDDLILHHDSSKSEPDEYDAYDKYFYGNRSYAAKRKFDYAWLKHIHRNPHHWQHWVLINDDPKSGEIVLDMQYDYVIEMICDWWAFSWNKGDLTEIFKWYDEHKDYMKLSDVTRKSVEDILGKIKEELEKNHD